MFTKSSPFVSKEMLTVKELGNLTEIILLYPKISPGIPLLKGYLKFKHYHSQILKCVNIVQEKQTIDIIHLNVIFPACISTLKIMNELKCPLFITEHWTGYSPEDGSYRGAIMKYYTKQIIAKAHTIIVISDYLKKMMESHQLYGNYKLVPNVIDTELFFPAPKLDVSQTRFIHISSLNDEQKNVSGIISAFSSAIKKNSCLHLSIVGEAPNKNKLQALASQLGILNNITFLGRLMENNLVQEINKHDALVMFSNYETFCLVIPESFSCGIPVITTNSGGISDYMMSELGIVIEPKNEIKLTESFLTFAQTKQNYNSEFIRKFAVTNFCKQAISQKLNTLYQLALA